MKTLSLWQPWASLVALGEKRIETRSWHAYHRGAIAIHATKSVPMELRGSVMVEPFRSVLLKHGFTSPKQLPVGSIVAIANLTDCRRVDEMFGDNHLLKDNGAPHEEAFGNYAAGRYMLVLKEVVKVDPPIPASGGRRLWDLDLPGLETAYWQSLQIGTFMLGTVNLTRVQE